MNNTDVQHILLFLMCLASSLFHINKKMTGIVAILATNVRKNSIIALAYKSHVLKRDKLFLQASHNENRLSPQTFHKVFPPSSVTAPTISQAFGRLQRPVPISLSIPLQTSANHNFQNVPGTSGSTNCNSQLAETQKKAANLWLCAVANAAARYVQHGPFKRCQ